MRYHAAHKSERDSHQDREQDRRRRRKTGGAATIADVARLAGVSPMTVSRVLNAVPGVKESNIHAVRAAVAELRYIPNPAAQALAGASLIRIGLVCNDLGAWFLSDLLISALDEAKRHQVQIVVDNRPPGDDPLDAIELLITSGIHAVLLPPARRARADARPAAAARHSDDGADGGAVGGGRLRRLYRRLRRLARDDGASGRARPSPHRFHHRVARPRRQRVAPRRFPRCVGRRGDRGDRAGGRRPVHLRLRLRRGGDAARPHRSPHCDLAANDDMAAAVIAAAHKRGMDVPADLTVCG
ncbi:LacI family DNA-binding transcriptional regulator [Sphingomonas sp. MMS24-JH45]